MDRNRRPLSSKHPGGYEQAIKTDDRIIAFLYLLLRDELPAGIVERLVCEAENITNGQEIAYSNDFLAAYAVELRKRLIGTDREKALSAAHMTLMAAWQQGRPGPALIEAVHEDDGLIPIATEPFLGRDKGRA